MNNISRIGIGCHKLQGGFEKKRSYKIICAALDKNINYFDTAPRYGDSEILLGEFLKGNNEVIISSKVGLSPLNLSKLQKNQSYFKREIKFLMKNNFQFAKRYLNNKLKKRYEESIVNFELNHESIKSKLILKESEIRNSLTSSLKNLNRNHLDLYFLHEPEQYANVDEIEGIFTTLRDEGLIRFYGLGFHRPLNDKDNYDESFITLSMFNEELFYKNIDKNKNSFSIIHGAMSYYKFAMNQNEKNNYTSPMDFLDKLTLIHPNKTFLMAPSNEHQL